MHIIFRNGLDAARKNAAPGFLLQCFALTLVLLYYFHAPTHEILLKIPAIKERAGILFPILSTAFFGGLIPFLFMSARKEVPRGYAISNLLFFLGYWASNGLIVDYLYKGQALLFGDQHDVITVIKKVCVDQFVFSVFWSAPVAMICMHWKNCGFSFRAARQRFSRSMLTVEMPSIIISIWAVWIPTVSIVYSLPLALQFPLFNIVLCFWSLMLTTLSKEKVDEPDCE
jgi:hypothetical protein